MSTGTLSNVSREFANFSRELANFKREFAKFKQNLALSENWPFLSQVYPALPNFTQKIAGIIYNSKASNRAHKDIRNFPTHPYQAQAPEHCLLAYLWRKNQPGIGNRNR